MSRILHVPWGRLRPGVTVLGEDGREHKVVTLECSDAMVVVLFWEGTRELHDEDAWARVRVHDPTD
jgi:hypothetical protein